MNYKAILSLGIILLASHSPCKAQTFRRVHAKYSEQPPNEILVELPTETNRVNYLNNAHKYDKAAEVRKDADSVIRKMVADFNDHFTYCPVYFFFDSNIAKVEKMDLKGVLLDKELRPIDNITIPIGDTSYFILYYGYEMPDNAPSQTRKNDVYGSNYSDNGQRMLIATDHSFRQLQNPLPYKSKTLLVKNSDKVKKSLTPYSYTSKHFDISYRPEAIFYSATLKSFYDPNKIKRKK